MDERDIKVLLLEENEEFKKVFDQHQRCEQRLDELGRKHFLTDDEKVEEKEIKKKKLMLKDKMYHHIAEYRKSLT